jgi:hypothetical protein
MRCDADRWRQEFIGRNLLGAYRTEKGPGSSHKRSQMFAQHVAYEVQMLDEKPSLPQSFPARAF